MPLQIRFPPTSPSFVPWEPGLYEQHLVACFLASRTWPMGVAMEEERAGECVQGVDSSGCPLLGCAFFGTSVPVYEGEDGGFHSCKQVHATTQGWHKLLAVESSCGFHINSSCIFASHPFLKVLLKFPVGVCLESACFLTDTSLSFNFDLCTVGF